MNKLDYTQNGFANSTHDIIAQAEARLKFIDDEGKKTFGVSSQCNPGKPPPWYDPVKFKRAQDLYSTFSSVILFSQFYGLITVYNIYDGLAPLLCTGYSATVPKLFIRYFSTIIQVKAWFEHDPFNANSKSYKSLKIVRGFHRQVATKLNEATNRKEDVDDLWMSQWSMMGGQFTFMGYMTVFPKELGFHCFTAKDFNCMFHFWRVIGYCLGIEDRFNLCSGTDEEIREMCHQMYWRQYQPKIVSAPEPTGVAMTQGITYAMQELSFSLNYNSLLRFGAQFMELDPNRYPLDGFVANFAYGTLWIYFRLLTRSVALNWLFARILKLRLWITYMRMQYHNRKLTAKYDERKYRYENDERCPGQVKINYQDAFQLNLY